jgi:hypothetical protein
MTELTVLARVEVNVGVAERPVVGHVAADAHGRDGRNLAEDREQLALCHVHREIADVQRRDRRRRCRGRRGHRRGRRRCGAGHCDASGGRECGLRLLRRGFSGSPFQLPFASAIYFLFIIFPFFSAHDRLPFYMEFPLDLQAQTQLPFMRPLWKKKHCPHNLLLEHLGHIHMVLF